MADFEDGAMRNFRYIIASTFRCQFHGESINILLPGWIGAKMEHKTQV
jgi:hypothetical protein